MPIDTTQLTQSVTELNSTVTGLADNITNQATGVVNKISDTASGLIGSVKDKLADLQNIATGDPAAIAAKLGIDTSALSGLSENLASQLNKELASIADSIPKNINLNAFTEQGLILENLTKEKLANLPAFQPKIPSPEALIDSSIDSVVATTKGTVDSLLAGATNLAPLTNINDITSAAGKLASGAAAGVDLQSITDKLSEVQKAAGDVIGSSLGVLNNIGDAAQNAIDGILPATVGLGSIESNLSTINNLTQSLPGSLDLSSSVTSLFGSRQQSALTSVASTNNIQGSI